jgi:HEAT repeat protein
MSDGDDQPEEAEGTTETDEAEGSDAPPEETETETEAEAEAEEETGTAEAEEDAEADEAEAEGADSEGEEAEEAEAEGAQEEDAEAGDPDSDSEDETESEEVQSEDTETEADEAESEGADADEEADAEADEADDDDEEEADEESESEGDGETTEPAASPEELDSQLDEIEADLEDAETEDELDELESRVDEIERRVETLPEADEDEEGDEEDEEDPRGDLEDRIEEVRATIEDRRGPYGEDVAEQLRTAAGIVRDTRWTETGEDEVRAAVEAFLEQADETMDADVGFKGSTPEDDLEAHANALDETAETIEDAGYDADDDSETIATLLEAAEELQADLDDAQEWSDLTVVEQLDYQGFYDELTGMTRKDYPPELSVVRIAESENDPDRVLLAMEKLTSEFMQENCIAALKRMGSPEAFDELNARAGKRNKEPIKALGKIGDPRALETLLPYIDGDDDPQLQQATLQAIGDIGDDEATQAVADRLVADEPEVRTNAARALGRIGDTRAIDPLSTLLAEDDDDSVRTSAAWALNQIGTRKALETASEYGDDGSYVVQAEAEKARETLRDEEDEREVTA